MESGAYLYFYRKDSQSLQPEDASPVSAARHPLQKVASSSSGVIVKIGPMTCAAAAGSVGYQ